MFDPSALGTFIILNDHDHLDPDRIRAAAARRQASRRTGPLSAIRLQLAAALRFAANRLDRTPAAVRSANSAA